MTNPNDYREFIEAKIAMAPDSGFDVAPGEINPQLKPFVREIVRWAAHGGRRGIFSSFGLHKTSTQIELARLARIKANVRPLICLPLGVRQEFMEDAERYFQSDYAVELRFIQSTKDLGDEWAAERPVIYLTNYESVREGKVDTSLFGFASLDEAACLRGFGGTKTFREFMARFAGDARGGQVENTVRYRFVATATPDPNEHIELLAYAAFLGVMDVGQAKTRFFKRNSEKADQLVIHPHKEREFWLWVASWALFVRKPSDLGPQFSDEGYELPPVDIRWHELPADHSKAGAERDGQGKMFADTAIGVQNAAKVKRESLKARTAKMVDLLADEPGRHCILWHDLEAERAAIEGAVDGVRSIYGNQDLDTNERHAVDFKRGAFQYLATKPRMSGAGCNFQHHCSWSIFFGIGFKFHDFIQAVHRLVRFGQARAVRLDLIYTEEERGVRRLLEDRWARHNEQAETMAGIIREFGLTHVSLAGALKRSFGVERREASGERFVCVNNDCVDETRRMADDSVDLIVTSIPFATQYEYTPNYCDFGHTDDDDHFFRQMDFLTPELLRVLRPGRLAAIHCKDRIVPGGMTGLGKTVQAFGFLNEVNEFPAVIVVQAHVQRHWERKISEFLDAKRATGGLLDKAGTTWLPLHGSKPKTSVPHADIYVVHYLNLNGWVELLHSRGVRTVVFDEVQEGRHRGTRKFDAILRLSRFARNVVGLSGTPIYNRGAEIYTVMDVLSRGCLGMRTEFRNTWCSDKDPEVVEDPQALGRYLQDRGLMIRRRKEDVLTELPAKRRVFEHVDADNEQFAELVQEAAALARDATRLTDPFDRARMEAEAITKARRATGIAKAPAAAAFVRGLLEAGEPTLVFCHHHAVHDTLADALAEFRPASITGRETAGGKDISQKRFEDGETNLCLIALRAATGIDGLQKRARVVLFVELDWSPAIHKQAEDRAHRMGQHDSVLVYYLIADLGTDPDMLASLKLKESQFTGLMQDREETKEDREAAREASAEHKAAVLAMLRSIR